MTQSGIYCIENRINHKIYIGSAVNFKKRWANHTSHLKKNKHHSIHLQNSYNKHSLNNFYFQVLEECPKDKLIEREQWWIDITDCCNRNIGYNLSLTAGSSLGTKHTAKTKKLISKNRKGKNIGFKHTQETKYQISQSHIGIYPSDETKKKISLTKQGIYKNEQNPNAKMTWETINNMRLDYKSNTFTYKQLGAKYNISNAQVWRIISNKTWN